MYGQLLDWVRWLVCWQPIILVLVQVRFQNVLTLNYIMFTIRESTGPWV